MSEQQDTVKSQLTPAQELSRDPTRMQAYQAYQQNIRRSEVLQSELIKGAKAGESPYRLLLKACEAISLMTGSDVLRKEVETSLLSVYGFSLGEKEPLQIELENTQRRLEQISEAMARTEDSTLRHGMDLAIRAHRKRIAELQQAMGSEEKD